MSPARQTFPQPQTEVEVRAGAMLERAFVAQGPERRELAARALERIEAVTELTPRLRALGHIAAAYKADGEGDLEEAARLIELAIEDLTEEDADWQVRMALEAAVNAGRRGRLEEAGDLLSKGLAQARARGLSALEGKFLTGITVLHSMKGNALDCLRASLEARGHFRRIDDPRGESVALLAGANAYESLGAYPEAMDALMQALSAAERAPNVDPSTVASIKATLAGILTTLGLTSDGERLAREALAAEGAAPQSAFQAWGALGRALTQAGEHEGARRAAETGLALAREIGESLIVVEGLLRVGDAARRADRWSEAAAAYDKGLALADGEGMSLMGYQIGLRLGRARVLERRGDIAAARREAGPLLEALAEHEDQRYAIKVHELLSRLAEAEGDARGAFEHLKEATRIKDDIARAESDARIRSIRSAHHLQREREQAIDRSRELSRLVIESQEEERRRIASELHDGLGQHLALLSVEIDLLSQGSPTSADEAARSLASLAERAQAISDQVYRISRQLHPAPLTQLGFVRATRAVCEEVQRVHGIDVEFQAIDVPERLPDDVSLCLYRVTQEAVNNALRHGKAQRVHVRVVQDEHELRLRVTDDGRGFQTQVPGRGIGLPSMTERLRALGGTLEVVSEPGFGTRLTARIPRVTPRAS